jgi:hypothetical protein
MSSKSRHRVVSLVVAIGLTLAAPAAVLLPSTPAFAQSAQAKDLVDGAKARGQVGEQGDGFLGFVMPSSDAGLTAAVAEINAGRAQAYREAAARTGVTPEAAGQATAQQLFMRLAAGQYFKPIDGSWTRK